MLLHQRMGHASLDDMKHAVKQCKHNKPYGCKVSLRSRLQRSPSVSLQTMPAWKTNQGITATQDRGTALQISTPHLSWACWERHRWTSNQTIAYLSRPPWTTYKVTPSTGRLTAMTTAKCFGRLTSDIISQAFLTACDTQRRRWLSMLPPASTPRHLAVRRCESCAIALTTQASSLRSRQCDTSTNNLRALRSRLQRAKRSGGDCHLNNPKQSTHAFS